MGTKSTKVLVEQSRRAVAFTCVWNLTFFTDTTLLSLPTFAYFGGSETKSQSLCASPPVLCCFPSAGLPCEQLSPLGSPSLLESIQSHASWPARPLNQCKLSLLSPLEWWDDLESFKWFWTRVWRRVKFICNPTTPRQPHFLHCYFAVFFPCM